MGATIDHRKTVAAVLVLHKGSRPVLEQIVQLMASLTNVVLRRGDLAHVVLFLWAIGASSLLVVTVRDLLAANRRLDAFIRKLALIMTRRGDDASS
jgi:hypothetical protein